VWKRAGRPDVPHNSTLANLLADQELVRYKDIRTYTSMSDDKLDRASAGYGAALRAFNVADWTQVTNIVSR
jgi:hypothetical protein